MRKTREGKQTWKTEEKEIDYKRRGGKEIDWKKGRIK